MINQLWITGWNITHKTYSAEKYQSLIQTILWQADTLAVGYATCPPPPPPPPNPHQLYSTKLSYQVVCTRNIFIKKTKTKKQRVTHVDWKLKQTHFNQALTPLGNAPPSAGNLSTPLFLTGLPFSTCNWIQYCQRWSVEETDICCGLPAI